VCSERNCPPAWYCAVNELELVARIDTLARTYGARRRDVVAGIGDDCAVVRATPTEDWVLKADQFLEDVHFQRSTHKAAECGHKALARALSDIAAIGAEPRFCLVSLAAAPWTTAQWIEGFYKGLLALAKLHKVALTGGDLSRGEKLYCDITVIGSVPRGSAILRSGARPGDLLYVSGALGGSALGLGTRTGAAWKRHLRPVPRFDISRALRSLPVTAAIDITDGLALDLHRLCVASQVVAELDGELPLFPGATPDHALYGGDDYELLFTLRPGAKPPQGTTRIGRIVKGTPPSKPPQGWDPFAR